MLTERNINEKLNFFAQIVPEVECSKIQVLKLYVLKERELYHSLNMMRM